MRSLHLTITRIHGSEPERVAIAFNNDADALSEVWRILTTERRPRLKALNWRRSDGVEFDLVDLRRWATQR